MPPRRGGLAERAPRWARRGGRPGKGVSGAGELRDRCRETRAGISSGALPGGEGAAARGLWWGRVGEMACFHLNKGVKGGPENAGLGGFEQGWQL